MTLTNPALFVFPHPDDEFAVSAWIRDMRARGVDVTCVYVTNGEFGGQDGKRRERETLAVLARLGVGPAHVHFLGARCAIPDGALHEHLEKALDALARVADCEGPLDVFCPAWEGGHQDHDAAHVLALALAGSHHGPVRVLQFPLYNGAGLPGPFFRVMAPLRANGQTKERRCGVTERLAQIRLCLGYPSQWKTWIGLLPLVVWHMLSDGRFFLQEAAPRRILEPPHEGSPLYARRGFLTAAAFAAATAPFIRSHLGITAQELADA